jgi:hypothetical protein
VQVIKTLDAGQANEAVNDGTGTLALPHDGMEPMRRMVRWTIDHDHWTP